MTTLTEQTVREALRKVIDPEIGMDVVTVGMIRKLEIDEAGKVEVKMVLTAPHCPLASYLVEQIRQATAQVILLDERWAPSWMEQSPE